MRDRIPLADLSVKSRKILSYLSDAVGKVTWGPRNRTDAFLPSNACLRTKDHGRVYRYPFTGFQHPIARAAGDVGSIIS